MSGWKTLRAQFLHGDSALLDSCIIAPVKPRSMQATPTDVLSPCPVIWEALASYSLRVHENLQSQSICSSKF